MKLNRRMLLRTSALALPAIGLAGCASLGITLTPAQVAQDAASIAGGLAQVVASLGTAAGLSSTDISTIAQWASTAQTAASGVASTLTASQALPFVSQIAVAVNTVVAILAKVTVLPAPIPTILAAAEVLLPVLESAVGIAVPAGAAPGGMSVAQARAVLGQK